MAQASPTFCLKTSGSNFMSLLQSTRSISDVLIKSVISFLILHVLSDWITSGKGMHNGLYSFYFLHMFIMVYQSMHNVMYTHEFTFTVG